MPRGSNQRLNERAKRNTAGEGGTALRRAVFAALACAPLWANAALAQAPAPLPHAAVGDVFVYARKFADVACARWEITALDQDGFVVSKCGDDTAYNLASTGALVRITGRGGRKLVDFTPSAPGVQFPLSVGKSWTASYIGYTADDGVTFQSQQSCKVSAFETVQVPAGALPAYRIDCDDHWNAAPFSGTSHTASWYSPQAHTVVKARNDGDSKWNVDLTSYTLHQG